MVLATAAMCVVVLQELPVVRVDRDDIVITQSCRLVFDGPVRDANGNGVIHVTASNVTLDLQGGTLRGSPGGSPLHACGGVGIRATAPGLKVTRGAISGFKVAIHATGADGALFADLDLSDNYGQKLKSTPLAEDSGDWLWPHANDGHEWLTTYGAALYVERSQRVEICRVKAWHGQNGIVLDRVNDSQVYDCDCSFLSGWGLAMWRSSRNVICRNALDFCVRGYSHGVYNRGQDSAGILCFEQCNDNLIALNSVTHGGDGFFGFAGKEALGELPPAGLSLDSDALMEWCKGRGCNGNILYGNDFSHAVAHGIELTFSFRNQLINNICNHCAICGVWGGYSQRMQIAHNQFKGCGSGAYGSERGGVNIEHGMDNVIWRNVFEQNAAGVHLWWDADESLMKTPWARANQGASTRNVIADNSFVGDHVAVELVRTTQTRLVGNSYATCGKDLAADAESSQSLITDGGTPLLIDLESVIARIALCPGNTQPVGARAALGGREAILMGPAGPYDWKQPRDQFDKAVATLMSPVPPGVEAIGPWKVRAFATTFDPRTDMAAFRAAAAAAPQGEIAALKLRFGALGPSTLKFAGKLSLGPAIAAAGIPADGFGLVATAKFRVDAGCWRIVVTSDDGVRVTLDGKTYIERWNWHAPTQDSATVTLGKSTVFELGVEYFELTGHAELSVTLESCDPK
jgi:parallel beta-helix repeat protein